MISSPEGPLVGSSDNFVKPVMKSLSWRKVRTIVMIICFLTNNILV